MRSLRLLVAMVILVGGSAWGDPKTDEAKADYETGRRAYNLGDFDGAIDSWKAGYKLTGEGYFLYNIAQAYKQKKNYDQAIFFYRSFLRENPNADNRDQVNQRIDELEKLKAANPTTTPPPPPPPPPPPDNKTKVVVTPPPPPPPPPPATPEPTHPGRGLRVGGIVTGGVGVALVVTGVLFAAAASSTASDLEAESAAHHAYDAAARDEESRGRRQAAIGAVGIGVGVVAIAGGVGLFLYGKHQGRAEVSASLGPGGGAAFLAVRF